MKKLLAVFVLCALAASQTFAQIWVSGLVGTGATLVRGTFTQGIDPWAGNFLTGSLQADAQDASARFGGLVQLKAETAVSSYTGTAAGETMRDIELSASAWWQPIVPVKLQIGGVDSFALTDIVGWGYHANDAEDYVAAAGGNYAGDDFANTTGFFGGTGQSWTGATLTVSPIYGLAINVAVPYSRGNSNSFIDIFNFYTYNKAVTEQKVDNPQFIKPTLANVYLYSSAQLSYSLYGVGKFSLSVAGGGDGKLKEIAELPEVDPENDQFTITRNHRGFFRDSFTPNAASVYASFLWSTYDMISINAGFGYTLPVEGTMTVYPGEGGNTPSSIDTLSYQPPLSAGLGVSLNMGHFGIKARFAGTFNGSLTHDGVVYREPFKIGAGLLPYYNIGACTFYLNLSASYKADGELWVEGGKIHNLTYAEALGWYVNPYITVKAGAGTFYAGVKIESDGLKYVAHEATNLFDVSRPVNGGGFRISGAPIIEWSIPIGILFEL